jgi:hypothetical protein
MRAARPPKMDATVTVAMDPGGERCRHRPDGEHADGAEENVASRAKSKPAKRRREVETSNLPNRAPTPEERPTELE